MKEKKLDTWILFVVLSLITVTLGIFLGTQSYSELRKLSKEENIFTQTVLEEELLDQIPSEQTLRDVYSLLLVAQGKNEARNFYVSKTKDGYLQQMNYFSEIDLNIRTYAARMKELQESLADPITELLYVGTSGKYIHGVSQIRKGYPENLPIQRNLDEFFLELAYHQVDSLDLRKATQLERMTYDKYYYRSHSVWTDQAAFATAVAIMEELRQRNPEVFVSDSQAINLGNYQEEIYTNGIHGDLMDAAGSYFTESDELSLLLPSFEVDMEYLDLESEDRIARRGDYLEVVINPEQHKKLDEMIVIDELYYTDDVEHFRLVNHQIEEGAKLLFLIDDYFLPVANYLALMNKEIEVLMLEENRESDIEERIEEEVFDAIIVASQASAIEEDFFNFYK
ncbi:alginate O-acetyltransferase AlgX-related protein [Enterococcus olivae]